MKISKPFAFFGTAVIPLTLLAVFALTAQPGEDALRRGFQNPPDSAKPRVWWHWMNGNITKEGIKADLEWMKRSNIAGMQNFDAALNTPQIVEKRLVYMTPEWKDAFNYAATLADQLGLELAIAGSPGWSESGGPWVPPAQAMKKFVWSETRVEGGRPFTGRLPKPPSTTGPFQNIVAVRRGFGGAAAPNEPQQPEYYADAAVVAFRIPAADRTMKELAPKVTSSGGTFVLAALTDGDYARATLLPAAPAGERAWIQFEFARSETIRGLTLAVAGGAGRGRGGLNSDAQTLEASDNGTDFHTVTSITGNASARTVSFAPVTARYFRVTFLTPRPSAGRGGFGGQMPAAARGNVPRSAGAEISELELYTGARVNRVEDKDAFTTAQGLEASATPPVPAADAVRKADVIDLTARMRPDGSLDWTPPAGQWCVLRLGYSLLGITNHPATPEATGLEVDKLNRTYVKNYLEHYLDMYKSAVGPLMGKRGLQYVITDSWEAGAENWTDEMIAEFAKRRGYDMHPWLPVLAGHVVESAAASDRFLFDFRRTIEDLIAENHYDEFETELKARGMGRYSESHEVGRAFIADGMEVKRTADVPMSAMWVDRGGTLPGRPANYNADIRESASVAHIYGQNLVAAESLTAGNGAFTYCPDNLKPTADAELAMGLNRFVIHTSVHQPVSSKMPGLSLGRFGQWFTRLETWADYAKYWTLYLARSSYMLQQGHFAADVLYYYGEDSNITALFGNRPPDVPAGYGYDFTNSDALLHRMSARDGRIVTPSGMSYRLLVLDDNAKHMPLPVLRKIRELVEAGVAVAGPKPVDSPSLSDDQAEATRIATELFGDGTGVHTVGKGKVYAGASAGQALAAMHVGPDFTYAPPSIDSAYLFVHRTLPDGEIYWVDNRTDRPETLEAGFRVQGKEPEIWHAETGAIEPAGYRIADGRTTVSLRMDPYGAVFVVFRKPTTQVSRQLPAYTEAPVAIVEGAWDVAFQPDRGAPAKIRMPELASWTDNADPGVKYFSGTGTYTKTIQAPAAWFRTGARLWLDLGEVKNLAEVVVNGKPLGVVWHEPFRVDVTGALKPGVNTVEVKVVNLWVNRIVGDMQPGQTKKYTWTAMQFYTADSPLLPSGLIGPVRMIRSTGE